MSAGNAIAVVGAAIRAPGAGSLTSFWELLVQAREGVRDLSDADLLSAGVSPSQRAQPGFVARAGVLDDIERFDARYFGMTPREAELADPQQRLLLELAVEALEDAGCDPRRARGSVGVYAGIGRSSYFLHHLQGRADLLRSMGRQISLLNDKDYAATQISYRLDLRGPSMTISSACSSSLLVVHMACGALLAGECDVALAAGSSINVLARGGYSSQEGNIYAPDGRCRAYDAAASGTVGGSGVGVVCLKRLDDALSDRDRIRAVILASAANNDGAKKIGLTAPSVAGQASVIREALGVYGGPASDIGFVEGHGTGTPLGDPIEVRALIDAFGPDVPRGSCVLGSVKTNVGHLDTAAGIAGFIKAVLAVERGRIPATLHFQRASPATELERSPFYVSSATIDWPRPGPRRAGISSLGMGGTNVHVIIEQPPPPPAEPAARGPQLWVVSAASRTSAEALARRLSEHVRADAACDLADGASTLQRRRAQLPWRGFAVGSTHVELAQKLAELTPRRSEHTHPVAMLFPGQGAQHPGMLGQLAEEQRVIREALQRCHELMWEREGVDLAGLLREPDAARLAQTEHTQPLLFAFQYALAEQWREWGVEPAAFLGHSIGELVAAQRAGVFSLQDAVTIVCARGRMMQAMPRGCMLAVELSEVEARQVERPGVWLAACNGPRQVVLSGEPEAMAQLGTELVQRQVSTRMLQTSHAFHSGMLEPALAGFRALLRQVELRPPRRPLLSNVTGTWLTDAQAIDPDYWAQQARMPVRFSACLEALACLESPILLDIGPRRVARDLAARHPATRELPLVAAGSSGASSGSQALLEALGQLWQRGVEIDWEAHWGRIPRRHVSLPTYVFERDLHWVERPEPRASAEPIVERCIWSDAPLRELRPDTGGQTLLLLSDAGEPVTESLARAWVGRGGDVVFLSPGTRFTVDSPQRYAVRPGIDADLERVCQALDGRSLVIVHAWLLAPADDGAVRERGFGTLMALARSLERARLRPRRLLVVGRGLMSAPPVAEARPDGSLAAAAALSWSKETESLRCAVVELPSLTVAAAEMARYLLDELDAGLPDRRVLRLASGRQTPALVGAALPSGVPLPRQPCVLLTGGLGGVGLQLAGALRAQLDARIVLLSRSGALGVGPDHDALQRLWAPLAADERVAVVSGDVSCPPAYAAVDRLLDARGWSLDGVIHAAGLAGGGRIASRSPAEVAMVLAPKTVGAHHAIEFARSREAWIVLCGSIAALDGAAAQAEYAAANAYLATLAESSALRGVRILAVDWGPWSAAGMAERSPLGRAGAGLAAAPVLPTLFSALASGERRLAIQAGSGVCPPPVPGARAAAAAPPSSPAMAQADIQRIWASLLGNEAVAPDDNFFDLGGDSALLVEVHQQLCARYPGPLGIAELFEHPTPRRLAEHLQSRSAATGPRARAEAVSGQEIAIIGMACRVPGAASASELWKQLEAGVESIQRFDRETLRREGLREAEIDDRDHVPAGGVVDDIERFDAELFGISPREAELLDPQQRLLFNCAHELLEEAGYARRDDTQRVGVFCGVALSSYLLSHLLRSEHFPDLDALAVTMANDKDFAATNLAHRLDLRGPALAVNSACSTSLVAVALACRALLAGDCELAIAGGARVRVPQRVGYRFRPGGILSPDGHCRAFDRRAAGTVFSNGAGLVLLKPLARALRDGDHVHAVIKGSAVGNDGSSKMSTTAPSVAGQVAVLREAYARAGVDPGSVQMIEAHGTGTALGDPIEVEALRRVVMTPSAGRCALGSIKTNLGHLDVASGVIGLIKAALSIEQARLPPSLHFEAANPELGLERTPFFVNASACDWPRADTPRRAGVSAFGLGGTNAHVVLEQAPAPPLRQRSVEAWPHVVPLSASNVPALNTLVEQTARALAAAPGWDAADVAGTWQEGRPARRVRRAVIGADVDELRRALELPGPATLAQERPVVMMFPGLGARHTAMFRGLRERFDAFEAAFARCAELARPYLGVDLAGAASESVTQLNEAWLAAPLLFSLEYACAELWESCGVVADVLVGHGLGEWVAATRAGVIELEQALELVIRSRGSMFEQARREPTGVGFNEPAVAGSLEDGVDHVLGGRLAEQAERALPDWLGGLTLGAPRRRLLSGTGEWVEAGAAADPAMWARLLCSPPHFERALDRLSEVEGALCIESGPGQSLTRWGQRHRLGQSATILSSAREPGERCDDVRVFLQALGSAWEAGANVDWAATRSRAPWRRVRLPSHPLRPQHYWIGPSSDAPLSRPTPASERSVEPQPQLRGHVPARSALEARIADIWARCLRLESVGVNDDFFDLGGDSLAALQVIDVLHRELGVRREEGLLLRCSTVAALSQFIVSDGSSEPRELVELRTGTGSPVVLVHPIGGHLYLYRALLAELAPGRPILGFRARGLAAGEAPRPSIAVMAEDYVEQLGFAGGQRPWLLGASFGGMVAYEMAERLERRGRAAGGVVMFDSPGPGQLPAPPADDAELLASLSSADDRQAAVEALRRLPPERRLAAFIADEQARGGLWQGADAESVARWLVLLRSNYTAMHAYEPAPSPRKLRYFLAKERRRGIDPDAPQRAWQRLVGEALECHVVEGNHVSMFEASRVQPMLRQLSAWMAADDAEVSHDRR